jgi:hypothetical protein
MNENCSGCESVAVAYQVILASDRRLVLTGDGRRELSDLRAQLRALAHSDLPVTDIEQQAQALMAGVATVLASELKVRAKVRCDKDVERRPGQGHHDDRADQGDQQNDPQEDAADLG